MATRSYSAQVLLCLFLLLSTSKLITRAQELAVEEAGGPANAALNGTAQQDVAKLLATVFSGIGMDLATISQQRDNATNPTDTAVKGLDPKVAPNLVKLINRTNNTAGGDRLSTVLESALAQQQSGVGLKRLEDAAATINNFLELPQSFGDGESIRVFVARVQAFQELRKQVKDALSLNQLRAIEEFLIATIQIAFGAAAVPLAAIAFVAANLALGAAITGLIAGIFYCVGSSLAIAASIAALPSGDAAAAAAAAAQRAGGKVNGTTQVLNSKWFNDLKQGAVKVNEPWIRFAFGQDVPVQFLKVANDLLGISGDVAQLITTGSSPTYPPTPTPTPTPAPAYPQVSTAMAAPAPVYP